MGRSSWLVNRLINQLWSVKKRLFIHRDVGVGNNSQGRRRARAIRGMPRNTGLMN